MDETVLIPVGLAEPVDARIRVDRQPEPAPSGEEIPQPWVDVRAPGHRVRGRIDLEKVAVVRRRDIERPFAEAQDPSVARRDRRANLPGLRIETKDALPLGDPERTGPVRNASGVRGASVRRFRQGDADVDPYWPFTRMTSGLSAFATQTEPPPTVQPPS